MNTRTRVLVLGGVIGTLVGVLGGWIYYNATVEQAGEVETVPTPNARQALQMGVGVLGVLRMLSGS